MAISDSDLNLYLATYMPLTIDGTAGGEISGDLATALVNTIFPTRTVRESGGSILYFYSKVFYKNDHATSTLYSAEIFLRGQEHPEQVQFALEKDGAGDVILNGTDFVEDPTTRPTNLTDEDFDFWISTTALLCGSGGLLGPGDAQGIWLKQSLDAGISADASVPWIIDIQGSTTE